MIGSLSTTRERTIFEVLAREHRELEARFAHVQRLGAVNIDRARAEYDRLAVRLVGHLRTVINVLYPRLASFGELLDDIDDLSSNLDGVERTITDLRTPSSTPSEWLRAVRRLEDDIEEHVESAERDVFPFAKRALSVADAVTLARDFLGYEQLTIASAGVAH